MITNHLLRVPNTTESTSIPPSAEASRLAPPHTAAPASTARIFPAALFRSRTIPRPACACATAIIIPTWMPPSYPAHIWHRDRAFAVPARSPVRTEGMRHESGQPVPIQGMVRPDLRCGMPAGQPAGNDCGHPASGFQCGMGANISRAVRQQTIHNDLPPNTQSIQREHGLV